MLGWGKKNPDHRQRRGKKKQDLRKGGKEGGPLGFPALFHLPPEEKKGKKPLSSFTNRNETEGSTAIDDAISCKLPRKRGKTGFDRGRNTAERRKTFRTSPGHARKKKKRQITSRSLCLERKKKRKKKAPAQLVSSSSIS